MHTVAALVDVTVVTGVALPSFIYRSVITKAPAVQSLKTDVTAFDDGFCYPVQVKTDTQLP